MSDSKSSATGPILASGFVITLIMIVAFCGIFFLLKYNHDRAAARDADAREYERQQQIAEERAASGEKLSKIGSVLGDALGDKMAEQLDDDSKAELFKSGLEKLGEALGREIGESQRSKELKEDLVELGERLKDELSGSAEANDSSGG